MDNKPRVIRYRETAEMMRHRKALKIAAAKAGVNVVVRYKITPVITPKPNKPVVK